MPLTKKGDKILRNMKKEYGEKKGESVFYASENKGTIKGVHPPSRKTRPKGSGLPTDSDYAQGFIRLESGNGQGGWLETIPIIGPAVKALRKQKKRIEEGSKNTGQTRQTEEE